MAKPNDSPFHGKTDGLFVIFFPTYPQKGNVSFVYILFQSLDERKCPYVVWNVICLHPITSGEGRGGGRRAPHGLAGLRRVTFQTRPYAVFWQWRLIRRIQNINDIALFLPSLNWDSRIKIPVAWITTIGHRQQSYLLETFRLYDENDCECEIFSLVSSARAWASVILAGKRGSRRHSTTSFSENVVVTETSYQMLEVKAFCNRERF